ncbi:MAG: DUF1499 domain-containing protein [Pseudomonadota bacterium]
MMRWISVSARLLLVGIVIAVLLVRAVGHDPERWHADPATAARTGNPNDYLVGPAGSTTALPDRILESTPADPLAAFDAVARAAPRTEIIAGSLADGHITYVQRSLLVGFPDYISVKRVQTGDAASIVAWSRSRFGYSDLGENAARIDAWLTEAGFR